jgi:hypothetical protein
MKNLIFTEIGKDYTKDNETKILSEIESLEWQELPIKEAPFSQGYALKSIIEEWKMPAKKVAMFGCVAGGALLGVETKKQQIFFVDNGCEVVPIGLRDLL